MAGIWLGTSGFSYPEWRPSFYPRDLPDAGLLRHYASRLNSVEIDSSFYRMPNAKTLESWKGATDAGFRFTLKASRRITHLERLHVPSGSLDYLLDVVSRLDDRLGPILYQLPPDFRRDDGRLERFLAALEPGIRSAFEFRHASWFCPEVYERLRSAGAALCVHDGDERTTPLELTAPFALVRLRRSAYDGPRIARWRRRFRAWTAGGVDVFAYVKHEGLPSAPLLARRFAKGLRAAG